MRPIIEFCASNMHLGTEAVMKELEQSPDYDVVEYGCLGNCGECAVLPFAMVDGTIVVSESSDELLTRIQEHIRDAEMLSRLLEEQDLDGAD